MPSLRAVRFALIPLALLLAAATPAFSQQQEQTLEERLLKPKEDLEFDLRKASGMSSRTFNSGREKARVKDFAFRQKFTPKGYQTKDFQGSRAAWFGDFKFSTKDASTKGKYEIPNASKEAPTKTMTVKEAHDADKLAAVRQYAPGDRTFLGKERERMNKEVPWDQRVGWSGSLQPMTINDVRELLNKNK